MQLITASRTTLDTTQKSQGGNPGLGMTLLMARFITTGYGSCHCRAAPDRTVKERYFGCCITIDLCLECDRCLKKPIDYGNVMISVVYRCAAQRWVIDGERIRPAKLDQ
jgi:hypothetical protein